MPQRVAARRALEAGAGSTPSTAPSAPAPSAPKELGAPLPGGEPMSKDEEKRRRELVKQIEELHKVYTIPVP